MSQKKLRAVIYARLSSAQSSDPNAESDSIANQIADLTALAQRLDYELVLTFKDDGISGYKGKHRPGFQSLLAAVADNKVDIILARHQDRLERNREEANVLQVATIKNKVRLQFADGTVLDPSTANGGLLVDILSAVARFESAVKTERLLMHYEGLRTKGLLAAPPGTFGYERFAPVPWEAELIRQAYRDIVDGRTVGSIVRRWNKDEVKQRKKGKNGWSYAHVKAILRRPRNAGLVADADGQIIEGLVGEWEPLVDVELWQQVQHIINSPAERSAPGFSPRWLGSGHAKCGICGKPMRSNTVSDSRTGTRYSILKCSRTVKDDTRHPSARNEHLDPLIRSAVIDAFAYGPAELFHEPNGPDLVTMRKQLSALVTTRTEARELWEQQLFSKSDMLAVLKNTDQPMKKLQDALNAAAAASASATMLVNLRVDLRDPETHRAPFKAMVDLKSELGRRFDALDIEQRRKLVSQLLDIRVYRGRLETNPSKYKITHTRVLSLNNDQAAVE